MRPTNRLEHRAPAMRASRLRRGKLATAARVPNCPLPSVPHLRWHPAAPPCVAPSPPNTLHACSPPGVAGVLGRTACCLTCRWPCMRDRKRTPKVPIRRSATRCSPIWTRSCGPCNGGTNPASPQGRASRSRLPSSGGRGRMATRECKNYYACRGEAPTPALASRARMHG